MFVRENFTFFQNYAAWEACPAAAVVVCGLRIWISMDPDPQELELRQQAEVRSIEPKIKRWPLMLNKNNLQWFCGLSDFLIANACTTQYEFIVANGQTTTAEFHKVV